MPSSHLPRLCLLQLGFDLPAFQSPLFSVVKLPVAGGRIMLNLHLGFVPEPIFLRVVTPHLPKKCRFFGQPHLVSFHAQVYVEAAVLGNHFAPKSHIAARKTVGSLGKSSKTRRIAPRSDFKLIRPPRGRRGIVPRHNWPARRQRTGLRKCLHDGRAPVRVGQRVVVEVGNNGAARRLIAAIAGVAQALLFLYKIVGVEGRIYPHETLKYAGCVVG